jgi:hypothetical protein
MDVLAPAEQNRIGFTVPLSLIRQTPVKPQRTRLHLLRRTQAPPAPPFRVPRTTVEDYRLFCLAWSSIPSELDRSRTFPDRTTYT